MRLEEAEKAGKFPVDDFFTSVFAVPKEEPKAPETDGESDSDSSDTATDVPSDTETAQSDENNEKQ